MSLNRIRKSRKGFTLVELLVVVLVIGVLLAIALPLYQGATRNAAGGTVKANLRAMFTGAQIVKTKGLTMSLANIQSEVGGSLDGKPANVNYTFAQSGTTNTLTATEQGTNDVFGTTTTGETITYAWTDGGASGTYGGTGN